MLSAEASGLPVSRKIFKHLIPNVMPQLIVSMTLGLGGIILTEATLGYLGIGLPMQYATWGNMINAAANNTALRLYPNLWVAPGICIVLAVLGFNVKSAATLEEMILAKAALVQTYGQGVLTRMSVSVIGSSDDNSVNRAIKGTDGISGVFVRNASDIGVITSIHGSGVPVRVTPVGVKSVTVKNGGIHKGIKGERVTGAVFYDCDVV